VFNFLIISTVHFKSYIIHWISTLKLIVTLQYSNASSRLYNSVQTKELNPRESLYQIWELIFLTEKSKLFVIDIVII